MKDLIDHIWWNRGEERASIAVYAFRLFLIPFSLLYGLAATLRNLFYDAGVRSARSADRPTVSVGNLTVGGTGKTPFVETVARDLASDGNRVAILSRGYGNGRETDDEALSPHDDTSNIRRWTNPDRLESARRAMDNDPPDLFLMDDGFQHRRMARDLDIVLVDGLRMFGNGYPLPAGPLREPVREIRRADLVVLTRANRLDSETLQKRREELERLFLEDTPILYAEHRPVRIRQWNGTDEPSAAQLRSKNLLAFCGIGTPASFEHTLRDDLELDPVDLVTYPDHYEYTSDDREDLEQRAEQADVDAFITTRKDAVKWPETGSTPLYYVEVEVRVTDGSSVLEKHFRDVLDKKT